MDETRLQQSRIMISCTFVTCFIANCELLEISLAATHLLFFSLAPGKNSRSLSLAPFLARCRSLSLSLRGLGLVAQTSYKKTTINLRRHTVIEV